MVAINLTLFATLSAVLAVTIAAPQAVPSPAASPDAPVVDPALSPVPTDAADAGAAAAPSPVTELVPAPAPTDSAAPVPPVDAPAPVDTPVDDAPVEDSPVQAQVDIPTTEILPSTTSFDGWGGFESLKGFDDFYGKGNFDGLKHKQIIVKPKKQLVCRVRKVEVIQQRLLVLQELAKKVITEKVCDVETQAIVFSQWYGGLRGFERDLLRLPGHHQVGYDQKIVDFYHKFYDDKGELTDDVWDLKGHDLGKNVVVVGGHNWDDSHSFKTVRNAWHAARRAWGHYLY